MLRTLGCLLAVAILVAGGVEQGRAAPQPVIPVFMTVRTFLTRAPTFQRAYAAGALDGYTSGAFKDDKALLGMFVAACVQLKPELTLEQIRTTVVGFMDARPQDAASSAAGAVGRTFTTGCQTSTAPRERYFFFGDDFVDLNANEQLGYLAGVHDALAYEVTIRPLVDAAAIFRCLPPDLSLGGLRRDVEAYIAVEREDRDLPLAAIVTTVLRESCRR